jgi:Domain of unknown function (DUF4304)
MTGDGKPAQEAFARLVTDHVQPLLKAAGFKKKALVFHRLRDRNYGLVHLQKSRKSTATSVEFTINVAVFSSRLQEGLAALTWVPTVTDVPTEPDCHLRRRVGSLLPKHQDIWWGVRTVADISTAWTAIGPVLKEVAVPFLDRIASDEDLRDYWLAKPEGTRSGPEDLALGVLLRDIGPRETLGPFLDRVRASAPPGAVGLVGAVERLAASAGLT